MPPSQPQDRAPGQGREPKKVGRSAVNDSSTILILFAHGSQAPQANAAVVNLASQVAARAGCPAIAAFLEIAEPDLPAAVNRAAVGGAKRVIIVPYFLTLGMHVQRDLPEIIRRQQSLHPEVEFRIAQPLEGHPCLPDALLDRMREAGIVEP